ncbi:MAG: DUF599 domain-containing protein [Pseudorhodoplanes sp.]
MPLFAPLDLFAVGFFALTWTLYAVLMEWTAHGGRGLNAYMHGYRDQWMQQMLRREMRMVDAQIMAALQNGTAFFASTSLIAVGGTLTILRSTEDLITIVSTLPFGIPTTRMEWEIKTIGLAMIFVYAFFKFAWSYRLYNYVAIMIGAMPPATERDSPEAKRHALRTGKLCESAGRHFNRGQRAFFFALGYLGWFISPWLLFISSIAIFLVMWSRQFHSDARAAVTAE